MNEAFNVQLHFQGAVPVFKGEHGAPVQPEIAVQHFIIKEIGDLLVVQFFIRGEEQVHDLHRAFIADGEFAVGVGVLASILCSAAQAEIGVLLVQPIVFVQDADALGFDGWDGTEQIPHDLEVIVHFPAAPHDVAHARVFIPVTGAAGDGVLFKDVDALAWHLGIPHQITGGGQGRQTGADDVILTSV